LLPLHDGVHSPPTHCEPAAHCVASAHWSAGFTHDPLRHLAPGLEQSLSFEQVDVPPLLPTGSQTGVPFASLHTKLDGQPEVEQLPVWHLLSAPQLDPVGQSDGFAQEVPAGVGGWPAVNLHRWLLAHEYPLWQSASP
jgi:hypothetical protein